MKHDAVNNIVAEKKVVNKVKWKKCVELFRSTWLKQASEQKSSECKHEPEQTKVATTFTEVFYLKEEKMLLKQILQYKDIIINNKESVIMLLTEKNALLEKKTKIPHQNRHRL